MKIVDLSIVGRMYLSFKKAYVVLKANAYGLGLYQVAETLVAHGADHFALINIAEAIQLRKRYPNIYLLMLGPIDDRYIDLYEKYRLVPSICEADDMQRIGNLFCEIKVNTGMNRFGVKPHEVPFLLSDNVVGLYTHIGSEQEFKNQLDVFTKCTKAFKGNIHIGGSKYIGKHSYTNRIGMIIYQSAVTVVASIKQIQKVNVGELYGYDFIADKDMLVAIIDIGYNEGLDIKSCGYKVFINEHYYPIVNVCMNHAVVAIDEVQKGEVEIVGPHNPLASFAKHVGKTLYETLVGFRNMEIVYKR